MWNISQDRLCIAVSGLSGCGNTSVSQSISESLKIACINYTFRSLAEEEGMDFNELRALARTDDQWDFKTDHRQLELSKKESCIIGSRLAIWMIAHASFRVYLFADERVRVQRIQKREGGEFETILHETHNRDESDRERYLRLYEIDIHNYQSHADLVIDTNTKNVEEVSQLILDGLKNTNLITHKV